MQEPPVKQNKQRSSKTMEDGLGDAMREVIRDPKAIGQIWKLFSQLLKAFYKRIHSTKIQ